VSAPAEPSRDAGATVRAVGDDGGCERLI